MRMKINGENKEILAISRECNKVKIIDQRLLPHKFEIVTLKTHEDTVEAIRNMVTRGAGSIGIAGGYGLAQAALEAKNMSQQKFIEYINDASNKLLNSRPTAVNLKHSIQRCIKAAEKGTVKERVQAICDESDQIAFDDITASRKIGFYGNELLKDSSSVLTHCNAGALAYIDQGTALSPIITAHINGKKIFVYVDETRPRNQGAKITAWEMQQQGISYALIADNAAGYFMNQGKIDMVIVGADRVAANGDVANKIGTYEKAVLAKENNIPFYVAVPSMTFDLECRSGKQIKIEERNPEELTHISGVDEKGNYTSIKITADGTRALNPSFDVTPAKYVTGFITDQGLLRRPYGISIKKRLNKTIDSAS
jgi:methylthioribose-1-phosphate isomerase